MINQLLRFTPILKQKVWGGKKLNLLLHKNSDGSNIGESWEISDVDGDESVVSNGNLKGRTLRSLLKEYKNDLVGEYVYETFGEQFPLLIKFIDAKEVLSIQVHPDDKLAELQESFGKTEMWYVMQADNEANIIIGFKENSNKEEYVYHLNNKTLLSILNVDKVSKGDVYFVPPGRVHAIGAGLLIAEIQQTSDITYRIYDWDRKDIDGNYRELHTEKALEAIDFSAKSSYKTTYKKQKNIANKVVTCPYFTTNILPVEGKKEIDLSKKDCFVIYMCVEGEVTFFYESQQEVVRKGETILVPACIDKVEILSENPSELLETYIK
ncbi:mannose-6-phosphate isomerase, type 1 [Tenacibaculum mesophilum]|uniref:Phosphohexomutase n=1 Tax=Tenacibaculum mesophilum TaxID=104268 RepID=A0ABM7CC76_9FLAO|nr:type I phosphomannose isomerase catalytic subunit [Tenacibaculum mesophilum]AZJ31322.1 mannose-6-phosphate isomerase [Tenacibaculum mesophilum]QFS29370.1 mannose-6-phosphate isomerase [Tenacibaculum mesophilum]SHF98005.1 mannose-6-phosphate isomerase, type 1 [Tenacibaculum mesophilum]|eukprot:TRINITY_DN6307_c0_g1_i1.p1 TRINITY_DN6307_c0_g1~~TRINITY_DN6307_c0_g1_i1.p1  ORF type:complete len:324 (+),score=53.94 TRINITY_DN6307_c0_g1_i1:137-1108(+)